MAQFVDDLQPEIVAQQPLVAMFTAPNPGPKTLTGTHTYVVGRRAAVVIDPGPELTDYIAGVAQWIASAGVKVSAIALTHGHPDHAPGAARLAQLTGAPLWAASNLDRSYLSSPLPTSDLSDGQSFVLDGDTLLSIAAPGHSADHVCFFLEEARILFTGDTVLGEGSTLVAPPEGNMRRYMATLDRLARLEPVLICPGHGPLVRDPGTKFAEYIRHRTEREGQVLAALRDGPATIAELVGRLYTDLDPRLHDLAAGSLAAQLGKLEEEGCLSRTGESFHLVSECQ